MPSPTIASDEDMTTGYLLVEDWLPDNRDALLGMFIVAARSEWDVILDAGALLLGKKPRGYRMAADGERLLPATGKRIEERWWVISGLDDAEVRPR